MRTVSAATIVDRRIRLRLEVTGAVQGVGFRPLVHRLATEAGLGGLVRNTGSGATLEVEGFESDVAQFLARLDQSLLPPASIIERCSTPLVPNGDDSFHIVASAALEAGTATVLPDLVTCDACLAEVLDPLDRRYRYPFTTCTACGPRYSILDTVPFDRDRTSMRHFPMCPACAREYNDPTSRRFHAETISCPDCGPCLRIAGRDISGHAALLAAIEALRDGAIVALKGLGGFQLLVDARNALAVARLRLRKCRPAKPFAVMVPSIAAARELATLTPGEEALLGSVAGPIVLVQARTDVAVAPEVAPNSPRLGLMLPTTPLHHLLLREFGGPLVATSGNRGDEPIISDEADALARLGDIADLFLVHDRPIVRPVDDSVVQMVADEPCVLRLARGYAPLRLVAPVDLPPGLALGGEQKNAMAIARAGAVILGPHIGDLGSAETRLRLRADVTAFAALHGVTPQWVAADAHPDYFSSRLAAELPLPVHCVPHHAAHVLSGMLDNGLDGDVLGIAWDGTGYGEDATIWGGECLAVTRQTVVRVAHFLPFPLPGGDSAAREPRRAAFGALHVIYGSGARSHSVAFPEPELHLLDTMLARSVNSPLTSSAGRLFDAAASILGLVQIARFEAEAAMAVEYAAGRSQRVVDLPPIDLVREAPIVLDWRELLRAMVEARAQSVSVDDLAAAFHRSLSAAIVAVAQRCGIQRVLLTGGCFQNVRLAEVSLAALSAAGFASYSHHRIPPNDGGIAAGQIAWAARMAFEEIA